MAHFAEIDPSTNLVLRVVVGNDTDPNEGHDWLVQNIGGTWIKTSYNTRGGVHYDQETGEPSEDQTKALRYNYAAPGFTYDEARDAFIPSRPSEDATFDEATCLWITPPRDEVA